MEPAEDLVFITIVESYGPDSYETSSWMKGDDKAGAALQSAKSSTTFSVPTCMAHGSKSVRTIRTRFITVMGFFVLFYPIIYYLLQIHYPLSHLVLLAIDRFQVFQRMEENHWLDLQHKPLIPGHDLLF